MSDFFWQLLSSQLTAWQVVEMKVRCFDVLLKFFMEDSRLLHHFLMSRFGLPRVSPSNAVLKISCLELLSRIPKPQKRGHLSELNTSARPEDQRKRLLE